MHALYDEDGLLIYASTVFLASTRDILFVGTAYSVRTKVTNVDFTWNMTATMKACKECSYDNFSQQKNTQCLPKQAGSFFGELLSLFCKKFILWENEIFRSLFLSYVIHYTPLQSIHYNSYMLYVSHRHLRLHKACVQYASAKC